MRHCFAILVPIDKATHASNAHAFRKFHAFNGREQRVSLTSGDQTQVLGLTDWGIDQRRYRELSDDGQLHWTRGCGKDLEPDAGVASLEMKQNLPSYRRIDGIGKVDFNLLFSASSFSGARSGH